MGKASRVRPKRLPEKLTAIRKALELTHEDLITKLNCPHIPLYRASISQYESGKIEPPLPVLLRYARLANIYVDVLIDDEIDLPNIIPTSEKLDV
jgi:transcriptional regulator with XRE-family HTH domain